MPIIGAAGGGIMAAAAAPSYAPQGVVFSTAWARQTTQLTGIADSGMLTVALAIKPHGAAGVDQHIMTAASTSNRFTLGLHRDGGNNFYVFGRNSGGTTVLSIATGPLILEEWNAILLSFNLSSTSLRHGWVNDVGSLPTIITYTVGQTIDFTVANLALGNQPLTDTSPLNAEVADLWVDYGRLVDFSVVANRRLFFAATTHCLVDKGPTGALPFGVAPKLFFKGPASGFITNLGTGGVGMSQISGTLTDSPIDPCGVCSS